MTGPAGQTVEIQRLRIDLDGFSLQDVSLEVAAGAFFLILGPTGAGKTLLLEAVAGLTPVTAGRIRIGGRDVTDLPPERRGVGIVYQDYALFPHLTVLENITYGIRYLRTGRTEATDRAHNLMNRVGIAHLRDRDAKVLSGGERQRVALVRALAVHPDVLLLDEPLSALDPGFRDDIQRLLKTLHHETGTTFLMVTHDFSEALYLGQQAAIIRDGRIEQTGPVADVFHRPKTAFAARFTGIKNVFPARFENGRAVVGKPPDALILNMGQAPPFAHGFVAIRPEEVRIAPADGQNENGDAMTGRSPGQVIDAVERGAYAEISVAVADQVFLCHLARREWIELAWSAEPGTAVRVAVPPEAVHPLPDK